MPTDPPTVTLWQLPNQTRTQMMSYVIRSTGGKVVVVDGGMPGDASYLRDFIAQMGNRVDAWFVTHPHIDHYGALGEILKDEGAMRIETIHASSPTDEWMKAHGSDDEYTKYAAFNEALASAKRTMADVELGTAMDFDEIHIEVLAVHNPELTASAMNNSSVVLRVSDERKSILLTADLGEDAGEKLVAGEYADWLHVDYVQMAHHGQNGANEAFYQHVNAANCLWPTPKWLWDNDNGGGPGSGPWRTLEVRGWMEKLPIERHSCLFEGLHEIV